MNYLQSAQALYEQMVRDRRHLHQHPEVGMDLPETCSYVMARLTEMGYQPRRLGGGVTATVTGKPTGRCSCSGPIWTLCPCVRRAGSPSPLSAAVPTPAATTCTPPCCWGRPSCSGTGQQSSTALSSSCSSPARRSCQGPDP